jgi:hypothetical protein
MTFTQRCICQSVMIRINRDTKIYKRRARCYRNLRKAPIEALLFWWSRSTSCKPSLPSFLSIYVRKRHFTCVSALKPVLFTTCHCCRYVRFEWKSHIQTDRSNTQPSTCLPVLLMDLMSFCHARHHHESHYCGDEWPFLWAKVDGACMRAYHCDLSPHPRVWLAETGQISM